MDDLLITTEEAAAIVNRSRQQFYIIARRHGVAPKGKVRVMGKRGRRAMWMRQEIIDLAEIHRQRLEKIASLEAAIKEA